MCTRYTMKNHRKPIALSCLHALYKRRYHRYHASGAPAPR